jgi:hypothetical protein
VHTHIRSNAEKTMSDSKALAAQFEYEYFGKSLPEISSSYGYPPALLELWSQTWSRKLDPINLPDTKDITVFAAALEERTRAQLTVIALFRQIEQQPLLAQIERLALEKTIEVLSNTNHLDDRAATKITNLVNAIQSLRQQNPIILADKVTDLAGKGGITVQIMNNIQQ